MSKEWSSKYKTEPDQEPTLPASTDTEQVSIIPPLWQKLDWFFDLALCGMAPDISPLCDNVLIPEHQSTDQNYKLLFDISAVDIHPLCIALENDHLAIQYSQKTIADTEQAKPLNEEGSFKKRIQSYQKMLSETL